MAEKRPVKVLKLEVLKPVGDMSWPELGKLLRDVRYRVFRLGNLAVSERYLAFHLWRTGRTEKFETRKLAELNKELRQMLRKDGEEEEALVRIAKVGAVPSYVYDALSRNKIRGLTSPRKWQEVTRGLAALPTFRLNMAIPIRCDKPRCRRLERTQQGNVELDLMMCVRPYPRIMLKTAKLDGGPRTVLERLLDNEQQSLEGYRQRCFEVKEEDGPKWALYVTYDMPAVQRAALSKERIVGVDVGYACPAYVAINNGHARLGWRHFAGLAARVRSLQRQVMARRRGMLAGGRSSLSEDTARSGHGRKRKLRSIEHLRGRIDNAYKTLNHQLSHSVVDFALNNGAGIIQMENLKGLSQTLSGTFLGARWRYHQLQEFIRYKAAEEGIEVRLVNPRFTSRRCSQCGFINQEFTREFRDANRKEGVLKRFQCPQCGYEADPDYNAARNLAVLDIEEQIRQQCESQGIPCPSEA
jgi:IS605 OrfB family transposase